MKVFPKISKEEWLAKVEKDLKGKPLETLDWKAAGIPMQPFYTSEDIQSEIAIPSHDEQGWEIGCKIFVNDRNFIEANKLALAYLNRGANSVCFVITTDLDRLQISSLLQDIELEWITTYFEIQTKTSADIGEIILEVIEDRSLNINNIKIGIFGDSVESNITKLTSDFPKGKFYACKTDESEDEQTAESLAKLLHQGNNILTELNTHDIDQNNWNRLIMFSLPMTDHYFLNIAKIRALKLLWARVLDCWNISPSEVPFIEALVCKSSIATDENYDKIRAGSQALAAAVAGADRIYVSPSKNDTQQDRITFSERIALNINHLLMQESHIGVVDDPSAGSYFIEVLTDQLCEAAWTAFQTRQKKQ